MTKPRSTRVLLWLAALLSFSSTCNAQWYQGPAGGHGGAYFDDWQAQGKRVDLRSVSVWVDGSNDARCFIVTYKGSGTLSPHYGHCPSAPGQDDWNFETQNKGIVLANDEYLLGIALRYDDHVNAIRFYTNKRTLPWIGPANAGNREVGFTAPNGNMIIGFIGRAGDNLDGLGVIYAECTPDKKPCR